MNVAAVVVWFDPQKNAGECLDNIRTYASFVKKVYIVDNSETDNSELASEIPDSVYFGNKNRGGIAGAQNLGATLAFDDGFEWIMTMDQDSRFDENTLREYVGACESYSSDHGDAVSFTLVINDENENIPINKLIRYRLLSPVKRFLLHQKNLPAAGKTAVAEKGALEFADCNVIASSNIVRLSAWKQIGGYDESLFIDFVDFDFSKRILLSNKKIVRFRWLAINHKVGEKKRSFFRSRPFESDFRLFYIFRNLMIMQDRYPDELSFRKHMKAFFRDNCVLDFHFLKHLRIYFRAKKAFMDYKKQ